jgi:hypothetical protein
MTYVSASPYVDWASGFRLAEGRGGGIATEYKGQLHPRREISEANILTR